MFDRDPQRWTLPDGSPSWMSAQSNNLIKAGRGIHEETKRWLLWLQLQLQLESGKLDVDFTNETSCRDTLSYALSLSLLSKINESETVIFWARFAYYELYQQLIWEIFSLQTRWPQKSTVLSCVVCKCESQPRLHLGSITAIQQKVEKVSIHKSLSS